MFWHTDKFLTHGAFVYTYARGHLVVTLISAREVTLTAPAQANTRIVRADNMRLLSLLLLSLSLTSPSIYGKNIAL